MNENQKEIDLQPSDEFEKFQSLVGSLISVPKSEIDRREREWRKERDEKKVGEGRI